MLRLRLLLPWRRYRVRMWFRRHVWDQRWGIPGVFERVLDVEIDAMTLRVLDDIVAEHNRLLFGPPREMIGLAAFGATPSDDWHGSTRR